MKNILLVAMIFALIAFNTVSCEDTNLKDSIEIHNNDSIELETLVTEYNSIIDKSINKFTDKFNISKKELKIVITTLMLIETSTVIDGKVVPLSSSTSFDSYQDYSEGVEKWLEHITTAEISGKLEGVEIISKRYIGVMGAESPHEFFYELKAGGYATNENFDRICIKKYKSIKNFECFE